MILATPPADSLPSWLQSAVIAALVSATVSFITIWLNARRSDRDRQRQLFAEAFGACIDYKEFVFIVRRRTATNSGEERTRITGDLSEVQRRLLIDCMRLLYFVKHPDRLEELRVAFSLGSIRDQRNLVLEMEKHFGAQDNDINVLKSHLDEQERELRDEVSKLGIDETQLAEDIRVLMKAEELFKVSPQPEGYAMFRHASHVVHTSTLALEMHKQRAEDGTIQLMWGGAPGNVLRVGLMSAQLFLFGYRAAAEMLGWDTIDEIRRFFDFTLEKLEKLREDAEIEGMEAFIGGVSSVEEEEAKLQDEQEGE